MTNVLRYYQFKHLFRGKFPPLVEEIGTRSNFQTSMKNQKLFKSIRLVTKILDYAAFTTVLIHIKPHKLGDSGTT